MAVNENIKKRLFLLFINLPWIFLVPQFKNWGLPAVVLAAVFASMALEIESAYVLKQGDSHVKGFLIDLMLFSGVFYILFKAVFGGD